MHVAWPKVWSKMPAGKRRAIRLACCLALLFVLAIVVMLAVVLSNQAKPNKQETLTNNALNLETLNIEPPNNNSSMPKTIIRTGEKPFHELAQEITDIYRQTEIQGWKTLYFSGKDRRDFICKHFDRDVVRAYDKFIPNAYKADLFRLCAVYKLGGVYADFSTSFLVPLETLVDETDVLVLCHDRGADYQRKQLLNAFFAAQRNHPFIKHCIDKIVANTVSEFYGINALHPSGPLCFRESFDACFDKIRATGVRLELVHNIHIHATKLKDLDQTVICFKSPNYSSLVTIDNTPRVAYGDLWHKRLIYHKGPYETPDVAYLHLENIHQAPNDTTFHRKIPKTIIRTGPKEYEFVSSTIKKLHEHTKLLNPEWTSVYFSDSQAREFILSNFDSKVLKAFDTLVPGAYKADLFRYCAVYVMGGVYIDFGGSFIEPLSNIIDTENDTLVLCHDRYISGHMMLYNALFAAAPQHPFLKRCIDAVVSNVRKRFYGLNALHPTGPLLMREVYDAYMTDNPNAPHRLQLTHVAQGKSYQIAINPKSIDHLVATTKIDDLTLYRHLLATTQKHYDTMWTDKQIYLKEQSIVSVSTPGLAWFHGLSPQVTLLKTGLATIGRFQWAFNGTIIGNQYIVRQETNPLFGTRRLAIFDWDDGAPKNGRILRFATDNGHAEDGCGIWFKGRQLLMFNDGYTMYTGYVDSEECFKMSVPTLKSPDYDGRQKNWSPFVFQETLHVLFAPGHVVAFEDGNIVAEYTSRPPVLTSGCIRGGTQLVAWDNKLYTVFHVLDKQHGFYWAGLLELQAQPPFEALRWSRTPLWKAVPIDGPLKRAVVTFPRHLQISSAGICTILAGYHDFTDSIITVHIDELIECID